MKTGLSEMNNSRFLILLLFISAFISCGEEKGNTVNEEKGNNMDIEENTTQEPTSSEETNEEWNYENANWEEIADSECRSAVQSPVNIVTEEIIEARLADISYEYESFSMKIVDNGHTIQVFGTEDSYITVEGKRYQFRQFHFHYPSEHKIDGEQYPMEMHLVHQEEGTSNLVVLGIFLEESGTPNEFLQKVLSKIPSEEAKEVTTNVQINLEGYIPPSQIHYTYIGSLTTPPCTMGVDWILFTEPLQASREQLETFAKHYSNNARPTQPLNNRRVLKSME